MSILVIEFGTPTPIQRIGTPPIFNKIFFETNEKYSASKAFNEFKDCCVRNKIHIKQDVVKVKLLSDKEFTRLYEGGYKC